MSKLTDILFKNLGYCDPALKDTFHREAKKALKRVTAALGLTQAQYDLRSNKAGIAVSGEVTLHTDTLYVQIEQSLMGRGSDVMYRSCNGRKDCTGGPNNFCSAKELDDPTAFAEMLSRNCR